MRLEFDIFLMLRSISSVAVVKSTKSGDMLGLSVVEGSSMEISKCSLQSSVQRHCSVWLKSVSCSGCGVVFLLET